MATMDEVDLKELADFLCSRGRYRAWHIAGCLTTYPGRGDEDNKELHAACLELERRGIIYRHGEGKSFLGIEWIVWEGKQETGDRRMMMPSWADSRKYMCRRCGGKWETLLKEMKLVPKTGLWAGHTVVIAMGPRCCPHCAGNEYNEISHLSACKAIEEWRGYGDIPTNKKGFELLRDKTITTRIECADDCPLRDWRLDG